MRGLGRIWNRAAPASDDEDEGAAVDDDTPEAQGVGGASGATGTAETGRSTPVIKLTGGNRPAAAAAGIDALATAPLYQRDSKIVYIRRSPAKLADGSTIQIPSIEQMTIPYLQNELGRRAVWQRYDRRRKRWVQVDVPIEIATAIAAMPNDWLFKPVIGVINTQTIRPDGTLLKEAGYDPQTGFVLFDPPPLPTIPVAPTRNDALNALQLIDGLLDEFPFANDASRSVALSLMMTLVLRPALTPAVPLHAADAPEGGTGKSYLYDVASVLAIGELTPVISRGHTAEETEKRLIGAALEGRLLIVLDNCNGLLRSEFLCQAVERPVIKPRPLGTTRMPTLANGFVCGANGNNIEIADDLVRRTLMCRLDANMEQPYLRDFKWNPVIEILRDRGRFIAAVLTIARAYVVAGMPNRAPPLLSFEAWSHLVRSSLIWLGRADPVDTIKQLASIDPVREQCAKIFTAIFRFFPGVHFTVSELLKADTESPDGALGEALLVVARGKGFSSISPERLGRWLKRNAGRIAGGLKLVRLTDEGARAHTWLLRPPEEAEHVQQADGVPPAGSAGNAGSLYGSSRNCHDFSMTSYKEHMVKPANPAEPARAATKREPASADKSRPRHAEFDPDEFMNREYFWP
jgi:putative DNA primase/helicase